MVAAEPSRRNQCVRIKPHHAPQTIKLCQRVAVEKLRKVYCRVCGSNLGNVQRNIKTGNVKWYLKTQNVGFRKSASDDEEVVRALAGGLTFAGFVARVGTKRVVARMLNELPEVVCGRYIDCASDNSLPLDDEEQERELQCALDDELDQVRSNLANARLE